MEFLGILLTLSGGMIQWCAITGRSPLVVLLAVAQSKPLPARDSWSLFTAQQPATGVSDAAAAVLAGVAQEQANGIGSDLNSGANLSVQRQAVVAFAKAQVGKRYVWDTAGPTTFDCSGLALAGYKLVGINLPHLASAQQKYGKAVTLAQAQPGDLVFWHTPASHVGIYVGNGQVVDAYDTKHGVQQQAIWDTSQVTVRSILPNSVTIHPPTETPGL